MADINIIEGDFRLEAASIGLIASRFNSFIVQSLVEGAKDTLNRQLGPDANESSKGLAQVSLEFGLPVINAILTTNTIEQAIERAGTKAGNKGAEAVAGAIEMVSLLKKLNG